MEPIFPEFLNIETTNRCNLKCVMCPRDKMTRAEGTMDMELYRKIVADCSNYVEHILVFGLFMDGEPLLDNLLEERIRIAKDAGIRFVDIATNGTLLNRSRARSLVESGLDRIIIAVEDIDKDVHERIRRGCDYNRVISNLENLIAIRNEAGSTTPEITVRILGLEENSLRREAFLQHWKTKVEHTIIVPAHNWGGAVPIGEKVNHRNTECFYLWTQMVIHIDGTVALCCLDYDGVHKLGNTLYETIYDIWHGKKFKEYRERFENSQIDLCNSCNWIPDSATADIKPEREKAKEGVGGHVNQYKKNPDMDILETGYCIICGQNSTFRFDPTVISAQLKQAWGLSDRLTEAFNRRESMFCSSCRSSLRIRRLCSALIQTFSEITGETCKSFVELLNEEKFCSMRIAEINACGTLHNYLKQHPNLYYSEFVPGVTPGETYKGVRCENLQCLTYPDDYFDIVLTSDTLEHVPDPEKAFNEIYRVLKPGGFHLFTVPLIPSQGATIRRARLVNGECQFLLAPAYHGSWGQEDMFVFTDFGMDIVHKLKLFGFVTDVLFFNTDNELDMAFAFRSKKAKHIPSATRIGEYPMLEWTGERFLPWIVGAQIHYEHIHRYAFAAHFVKGKKVLDLACGEGYGTHMLAREAEYVAGVEIDKTTVQHARSRYIKDNLEFIEGSILAVPIEGEKKFDVVVCFEAIEHIAEHDKLLSEVKRLLKDDGLFIVSTPNKAVYTDEPDYHNPFHIKELDFDEFKSLLRQYFAHMLIFGQRVYAGSNMWSIPQQKSRGYIEAVVRKGDMEFYFAERTSKEPVYFIALASNASLKPSTSITDSWLTDASNAFFNDYERRVRGKAAEISSLGTSLQEKVSQIHSLESQIHSLESQIQQIQLSIPMRLASRYQGIVGKLLRSGTRRRRYYELGLNGIRVILNEGWRSFFRKVKAHLLSMYRKILERLLLTGARTRYYCRLVLTGLRVIRNEGWRSFWSRFKIWLRQWMAERKRLKLPPLTAELADDWSDYWVLSREITKVKRRKKETFAPKPLRMISIDEDKLVAHARSLQFPVVQNPRVSIVIPVYGNDKLTIECLTSILRHTKYISYEIVVIDDGSAEKTKDVLSQINNITYLRNQQNLGFLLSCNRAAEKARGDFLLILNNDVQVTEGWLSPMVETFSKYENVGAVSPKILYPDGRLQEAGARIRQDASSQLIGLFGDPDLPRYNYIREVEYSSAVCLMLETRAFRELGGFDTDFAPAYCEDIDLCFRLRKLGKRIFYNPGSMVIHHLSATVKVDSAYKRQLFVRNTQKLAEKWQEQIDDFNRVRLITFYLPQFHSIPENDRWWGEGFTDWANVRKGRPNFAGHYQPHSPADLGFYDLRNEEVMEQQAELAKRYGIYGLCYFYYWFGGKRLLEMPLERMLKAGKPDIPFCICWANENWTRRWDGREDLVLIGQQHSDEDDYAVIKDLMRYMRHPNYIRINGKPLLLVYRVSLFPDIKRTTEIWRDLCCKEGIGDIYLAMVESFEHAVKNVPPSQYGFDASVEYPPHYMAAPIKPPGKLLNPDYTGLVSNYREIVLRYTQKQMPGHARFRTVMPGWDNTPRRQNDSVIFVYSSPGAYQAWLEAILDLTLEQNFGDERIVFINAWNEWAEGNHLEPDQRFGHGFLEATRNALERTLLNCPPQGGMSMDSREHNKMTSRPAAPLAVDQTDELVPPIEMIFDGATSIKEFKEVGEGFTQHYLIERAKLKPDEKMLDVGCGIGQKARVLAKYLSRKGVYHGFDIVPAGITWCKEKYQRFPNFHFQLADIYNSHYNPKGRIRASEYRFPHANETFDLVFLSSVFTHMLPKDAEHYLGEIVRVLKRHGRCVITFFLLNPRSLRGIDAKLNTIQIPFEYGSGECRVADLNNPETIVAYDESFIRNLYERHGLSVAEITYGFWCGRKELWSSLQDIIIAVKE